MSTLAAGNVIDARYCIEETLGVGGMASVHRAKHLALGHTVAVKVASDALLAMPGLVTRFLREAEAATQLKSEHIARVHDVGTLPGGAPYMVMEYLDGRDLETVVDEDGPLAVRDAVDYVLQTCEALAEVHGRGMVHRDIKPANLFLVRGSDGRPFVKLIDFGIARASSASDSASGEGRLTEPQVLMGSPLYMAPEQIQSAASVDPRSDIWSLGVVLYELVSGTMPFEGGALVDLLVAQTRSKPERPAKMPSGLYDVVLQCLAPDPNARFSNVAALADALAPLGPRGLADLRAANVRRTLGAASGAAATPSRKRFVRPGAKIAAAAVLLAFGVFGIHRSPSPPSAEAIEPAPLPAIEPTPLHPEPPAEVAPASAPPRAASSASKPPPTSDNNLFEYRN